MEIPEKYTNLGDQCADVTKRHTHDGSFQLKSLCREETIVSFCTKIGVRYAVTLLCAERYKKRK